MKYYPKFASNFCEFHLNSGQLNTFNNELSNIEFSHEGSKFYNSYQHEISEVSCDFDWLRPFGINNHGEL